MPTIFPELRWAQRSSATEADKNKLWITVAVPNLESYKVDTTDKTFKFTGKDASREYALELELYAEIDAAATREAHTAQSVVVELRKKEAKAEYWPRLAKDTARKPYIRTDFDKWVDEDEQDEAPEEDPLAGLGGLGGGAGGFPSGGAGGFPGGGFPGAGGGASEADMLKQLAAMQQQMGGGDFNPEEMAKLAEAEGGALGEAEAEDENDEPAASLGKAQD